MFDIIFMKFEQYEILYKLNLLELIHKYIINK